MDKELWIYAHWKSYSKQSEYQLSNYERSESSGDVLIEKQVIVFETPNDKELKVKLAAAKRLELIKIKGEHFEEQARLQEEINDLLTLEYKPEAKDDSAL